ncbi:PAS domain-containing sensor histidine kinase [Nisaea sp.]|uniref:PAS domain-containing sensor histidine kinase n=1 Tax=Nisaea sp. TaxID=2024842 RepID=UPI003B529BAE
MFRYSIALGGVNLVLLAVLVLEWAGVGPIAGNGLAAALALAAIAAAMVVALAIRSRTAERELRRHRESEFLFGALFEHSPVCMNLKDPTGRYLMANRAYCEWYGKPLSDVIGTGAGKIISESSGNRAEIERVENEVARTGRPATLEVEVERFGRRHNRLLVKFPALDDRGVVIGLGTVAIDVTDMRETQLALSAERERAAHLEAILRGAIMAMPAAFAIFDRDDKLVICNRKFAQFNPTFRNDPDLAVGLSFRQVVSEIAECGLVAGLEPEETRRYVDERVRSHLEASGAPYEEQLGERTCLTYETRVPQGGVILLRQDVTERRALERRHQEAEDLLRNLFDNFGHGIMIRDRETRLVRANKAALEQIGLSAEQIVGRTTAEMFELLGIEDDAASVTAQELEMMEARTSADSVVSRAGTDGKPVHLRISRFPLVDRNDEVQGLGVLRYDVTELIESQRALERARDDLEKKVLERTQELRVNERRFRILAHASADWFWECDADLRFTYLSSDNFPTPGGLPLSRLLGMKLADYHVEVGDSEEVGRTLLEAYNRREPIRDYEVTRTLSGTPRHYRMNAIPLWENGVFEGYVGATTDISELHEARQSLIESERLASLGSMVAGIAHEINTPIGVCVTAGSTVSRSVSDLMSALENGKLKKSEFDASLIRIVEGMRLVDANLERAAKLISSFKSIAVDQTSEEERTFNLLGYLQDIMDSLSPQLRTEGVTVSISGPDDIVLRSYPGAIAQILTNLVMNSIIHGFPARDSGKISITVARSDAVLELTYADDGEGMPEETVKRIFDPFFTTKRGQGGSGLGMHILFNLVTQVLKGTVRCDSVPGEGVEIVIRFPMVEAAD